MANTFKFGNGNWAVGKETVLAYNDQNNNFKPLPFSFTRDSIATYVDSDGLIKTAGKGEARIDYLDNADGHLLLEPSRTNVQVFSAEFNNVAWTKTNVTVTEDATIAPDGTNTAEKIVETNATGLHYIFDSNVLTNGAVYTYSIFAKAEERKFLRLRLENSAVGSGQINAVFNLEDGTTPTSGASIENYGNGWYRCTASGTTNATNYIAIVNVMDSISTVSYTGDGSSGLYLWGAQLELGSYATSLIKTEGSSVTRVAESNVQTIPSGILGTSQGSFYIEGVVGVHDTSGQMILTAGSGIANIFYVWIKTDGKVVCEFFVSTSQASLQSSSGYLSVGDSYKISGAYQDNDFVLYVNGTQIATDLNGTAPNPTTLRVAKYNDVNFSAGKIKNYKLYDTRLSNSELAALTT